MSDAIYISINSITYLEFKPCYKILDGLRGVVTLDVLL